MGNFLDNNPIGNLVGAGVGALDSVFGWSQKRQENSQKRLMEQQQNYWKEQNQILNQQQLDQWNRENIYNDPTNAYRRLLDAADANGISKAAILGKSGSQVQSQSASGVKMPGSTSMPSTSGAPQSNIGLGVMQSVNESMRNIKEMEFLGSQINKNDKEAGYIDAKTTSEQLNWNLMQTYDSVMKQSLSVGSRTIKEKDLNLKLMKLQEEFQTIQNKFATIKNEREIDLMEAEYEVAFAKVDNLTSDTTRKNALLPFEVYQMKTAAALNVAYSALAYSNRDLNAQEYRFFEQNFADFSKQISHQTEMLSWQAEEAFHKASISGKEDMAAYFNMGVRNFSQLVGAFTSAFSVAQPALRVPKALSKSSTYTEYYDGDGVFKGATSKTTSKK